MNSGTPYVLFVLALCLFLIASLGFGVFLPTQVALMCAQWVGLLGTALLFRRLWVTSNTSNTHEHWPSLRRWGLPARATVLLIVLGVCLALWANVVGGLVSVLVPGLAEDAAKYTEANKALLMPESLWLAIVAGVTVSVNAPLCEEMLFRGAMLPAQRQHPLPLWAILLLNGALFALIHFSAIAFLPLMCLGAMFAYLTVISRSIWPAILAHGLVNLCNGVIFPRAFEQATDATTTLPLTQLLPAVVILSLGCGALWWMIHRLSTPDTLTDLLHQTNH